VGDDSIDLLRPLVGVVSRRQVSSNPSGQAKSQEESREGMNDAERDEVLRERYLRLRVTSQRVLDAAAYDGEDARVYVNQLRDLKRELAGKPQPNGMSWMSVS
jgi:hypothetical protein